MIDINKGKDKLKCDYCGKAKDQVKRIITGGGNSAICGECVITCMEILLGEMMSDYKEIIFDNKNK